MSYQGDYKEDETLHFLWNTSDGDGASITRATNGEVRVYKDNNVAQSTAGVTDTKDFDGLTGVHACTIDLSADAFYAVGADYSVVLQGATIDGQVVNAVLAHFSIENRVAAELGAQAKLDVNAEVDNALDTTIPSPTAGSINEVLSRLANWFATGTVDDVTPQAAEFDGDNALSAAANFYNGMTLLFIDGNLIGQSRVITSYGAANETFTFDDAFVIAPADGDAFIILNTITLQESRVAAAVWGASIASHQVGSTFGDAFENTPIVGVELAADALIAAAVATSGADKIADALLRMTTATVEAAGGGVPDFETVYGLVSALVHRHKMADNDKDIIIYQADGETPLVTIVGTTDAGLEPLTELVPP